MEDLQRDLGKHDAQIDALDKDLREMKEDMRRIFEKLEAINATLSEAKGGWKTLMWVAGASAALGGVVVKLISLTGK
jgi:archaellum component FlaC